MLLKDLFNLRLGKYITLPAHTKDSKDSPEQGPTIKTCPKCGKPNREGGHGQQL